MLSTTPKLLDVNFIIQRNISNYLFKMVKYSGTIIIPERNWNRSYFILSKAPNLIDFSGAFLKIFLITSKFKFLILKSYYFYYKFGCFSIFYLIKLHRLVARG